jgi:hypothetical protein
MPIGSYAAVGKLVQTLIQSQPRSVLDLGMGFGGGGVLVREWLDLGVQPWKTFLVGVECWADYRNPVWDLYNVVYLQTIEQFLCDTSDPFECILLMDVLEHFDGATGASILRSVQARVADGGTLLVTTPVKFFPQAAVYGNDRERHHSCWSEADLKRLSFQVDRVGHSDYFCGECWFAHWRR